MSIHHPDPDLAIDGRSQEGSLNIAGDEFAAVLGCDSKEGADSHMLGDGRESIIEVNAFFHKLTFDDDAGLVLVGQQLRVVDGRPAMLDAEHPVSRRHLDRLHSLLVPLFAKGAGGSWQQSTPWRGIVTA